MWLSKLFLGHTKETGLMTQLKRLGVTVVLVAGVLAAPQSGLTHGDVTPQAMETKGLLPLGEEWLTENPYRGTPLAIQIGEHGYTQNCARCHGIDAISGAFLPICATRSAARKATRFTSRRPARASCATGRSTCQNSRGSLARRRCGQFVAGSTPKARMPRRQ